MHVWHRSENRAIALKADLTLTRANQLKALYTHYSFLDVPVSYYCRSKALDQELGMSVIYVCAVARNEVRIDPGK